MNLIKGAVATLVLTALLVWPDMPGLRQPDLLNTAILACQYTMVALSLVLLIGLVGQISLAQASLVGMGAFVGALATKRYGVTFPLTLLVGLGAGATAAGLIGLVALRVRGLYLAVATLIFAYICDQYLFAQPWLVESQAGTSIPYEAVGTRGALPYFDLGDPRTFYFIALAVAALTLFAVRNIRDSRVGRAFAAVRGSEVAAASLGIDVTIFKLLGFACAGGIAGMAGALTLVGSRNVAPEQFSFMVSLFFLSVAVVGGLRSLGGALTSALLFALLVGELFYRYPKLSDYLDVISAALLIVVLLFFRGGLGAVPERLEQTLNRFAKPIARMRSELPRIAVPDVRLPTLPRLRRKRPPSTAPTAALDVLGLASALGVAAEVLPGVETPQELRMVEPQSPEVRLETLLQTARASGQVAGTPTAAGRRDPILLAAEGVTVRFGGLTAVRDASMRVCAGEIVGLMGPNGAGKTTLFNSILGLNQPSAGRVLLYGRDVSSWPVHRRAALGVGRTFQILQLFGDLTVFDNLLVATHLQNRTGLFGALAVTRGARRREDAARARVSAALRLMDLDQFAQRKVAGLPFGVLRLVEVARTLVTGARLVCFDEPASGLDSAETERLIEWFRFLRQVGITLLVIEHDVDMVMRLCDYVYVLDQGSLISEGPPSAVQRDAAVINAYLGTSLAEASA